MDAVVTTGTTSVQPSGLIARLSAGQKISALIGFAALLAVAAATYVWSKTPDYRVLFANLNDKDGGAVIASLAQMNIAYKMTEGGAAIMVPAEHVHDLRLRLASQGLPKGGTVGFELLENQKFGVTQFQERMNYQRGLEGELARSIQSMAAVSSARVHLALPAQTGFFRDQQKPSASVVLTMNSGRSLERSQIAGIVHLVASSVHDLNPKQVSVIDQTGNLLSDESENKGASDATQLQYTRQIESTHTQRIVELLEPLVGKGNVRAQVNAELDFTQSESTAEIYKPNQAPDQVAIRSQQLSESPQAGGASGTASAGVPGALSNQPVPNPTAPINAPAQPLTAAQSAAGAATAAGAASAAKQRDSTTNFEVDKTIKVVRNPSGTTKRISVAVIVNHTRSVDEEGKATLTPIKPEQLTQMTALVKDAVGFNTARGDSVNLVNAPFTEETVVKEPELPIWKEQWVLSSAKEAAKYAGLLLLTFIIISKAIKPTLKAAKEVAQSNTVNARVDNALELQSLGAPQQRGRDGNNASLQQMLSQARQDPTTVANVVKTWVDK